MKNKHFYKFTVIMLLAIVTGAFTHCVQNSPVGGSASSGSSRSPSSNPTPPPTPEQVINQAQVEVGVRNFEQINLTFAELTGVNPGDTEIAATYADVSSTLPSENDVKGLQPANQVAVTRLAAEYCSELFIDGANSYAASRNAIYGNLLTIPFNSLSEQNKISLVNVTTNAFWGEGTIDPMELADARAELRELIDVIAAGESAANLTSTNLTSGVTSKAARALCIAALSSAYVIIM